MRQTDRQRPPRRVLGGLTPERSWLAEAARRASLPDGGPAEQLAAAMTAGDVAGPVVGEFPRYAWRRIDQDRVCEFELVDPRAGRYRAHHLHPSEWPEGL